MREIGKLGSTTTDPAFYWVEETKKKKSEKSQEQSCDFFEGPLEFGKEGWSSKYRKSREK